MDYKDVVVNTSEINPIIRDRFPGGENMICFSMLIYSEPSFKNNGWRDRRPNFVIL